MKIRRRRCDRSLEERGSDRRWERGSSATFAPGGEI